MTLALSGDDTKAMHHPIDNGKLINIGYNNATQHSGLCGVKYLSQCVDITSNNMLPDEKKELHPFNNTTTDRAGQSKRIELLQSMPIFGGIRSDTLAFLLEYSRQVDTPKDSFFYHEKDPAQSLFVLEQGKVMLLKTWHGDDYILKDISPGNCFGEVALMDLQPRNTSSLAIEDSSAIEISDEALYKLYKREIAQFTMIRMNMAREVCRRLREADSRAFAADIQARRLKRTH